jgi:hypothetical protein
MTQMIMLVKGFARTAATTARISCWRLQLKFHLRIHSEFFICDDKKRQIQFDCINKL